MSEHYTSNTVSATGWCPRCQKNTQHRVDGHKLGPCLECIARAEKLHASKKPAKAAPTQSSLFAPPSRTNKIDSFVDQQLERRQDPEARNVES